MEVLVMTTNPDRTPLEESPKQPERRDRTHWLYVAVLVAVAAGVVVGLLAPSVGRSVGVLGTMFVDLIKMIITPVIFCTIVLGIGSLRKAATIGKVGGLALVYFVTMSTFALAIGLVVGNLLHPGANLQVADDMSGRASELAEEAHSEGGLLEFIQSIIPDTLFSALTSGNVLQALFLALITGFAIQALPRSAADPALRAIEVLQKVVFKILVMILWLAPIGAFGAIANVVARTGWDAVVQLMTLMLGFYITCVIFVFGVLGALLRPRRRSRRCRA
jgi:aerobic C4-dicarboxylate transport protein